MADPYVIEDALDATRRKGGAVTGLSPKNAKEPYLIVGFFTVHL